MSVAELRNICEERKIKRVAMVDDVFDIPSPAGLDRHRYSEFRTRYNSDPNLKKSVHRISGTEIKNLPSFDDLSDEDIEPLWRSTWRPKIGGRKLNANHTSVLQDLFQGHDDDALGMLDTVVKLLELFRDELKTSVTVHGTDSDADEISSAQIVIVDYFLGFNLSSEKSLDKASQVVLDVIDAARRKSRSIPSFLLVSSHPRDIDIEEFRKRSGLMQSRFRFFSKKALRADSVEDMINLHDLVDGSDRTERIERLIKDWRRGASDAINEVSDLMLKLDLSDLVYLDCFRLTHEGTSIGNYLRWFLTALLNAGVTSKLTADLWRKADVLKLFSVTDESGRLDRTTLTKTFDGPSDVIAHAYGDILFDETRGTGACAFPGPLATYDLIEGDLFVRPKGKDRKRYQGAEVRLVLTPSCDLRPRVQSEPPSARSVLLLPGTLNRMDSEHENNNFAQADFVRVQERGEWRLLQIKWDYRHPISVDWKEMCDNGPGKGFRRLGRIRELYFHKVRNEFTNHLVRIGTEVAPLYPLPRSGEVYIAVGSGTNRRFEPVMCFSSEDRFVWEIGPVPVVGSKGKYVYQTSRDFIRKLSESLEYLSKQKPDLSEAAKCSIAQLRNMRTYMDLVKPMIYGPRGENSTVEIRKTVKRSDYQAQQRKGKVKSAARLLIVTFID